jgi:hypothetical protein
MKYRNVLRAFVLGLAVLALATLPQSASASVIGTLFTGSSGQITVTTTSITWNADASGLPVGSWNGDVTTGTDLTFLGCTGGLGDPGCLSVREGIDINHLAPLVSGVTPFPIDGFLTFAAHPLLDFTLTGVSPGSANLNCSGLAIGQSCSVIAGSPIILTLLTGNRTSVQMSMFGTATDGSSGPTSYWTGGFSATLPTMTPAAVEAFFAANPDGSLSASNSGSFFATTVPEPVSMALIGGGLLALAMIRRRKRV